VDRTDATIENSKRLIIGSLHAALPWLAVPKTAICGGRPTEGCRETTGTTHHDLVRLRYEVYSHVSLVNTQHPRHANWAGEQGVKNKTSRPSSFSSKRPPCGAAEKLDLDPFWSTLEFPELCLVL